MKAPLPIHRASVATAALAALAIVPSCGGASRARDIRADEWYALSTPHVQLETDVGSREARETAWALEDVHRALAQVFVGCRAGALDAPVDVTLLAHAEDYVAVAPSDTLGFFWPGESDLVPIAPRVVLPARSGASREAVVQTYAHELTHRFVEACLPDAPTWLNEGLAKYFETMRVSDDDVLVGTPPYRFDESSPSSIVRVDGLHVERVDAGAVPSATALLALSRDAFYAGHVDPSVARANYAAAWALVHMMLAGPDDALRARFSRYLAALIDGATDPSVALETLVEGLDLDALLASYVRANHVRSRVPYAPGSIGEPLARRLEVAEVNLRWGDLLARFGSRGEARAHLQLASRNPLFETRALLLLASISGGIERHDLVARAEAIAPQDRDVLAARAWIAIEENGPVEERIQLLYELAALESPTAVELTRWAELARLNGDGQPAVALSQRAVQLDPTSWEAQASFGLSLASAHRLREARLALERALHLTSHHLPGIAAQLERLITRVDDLMPRPPGEALPAPGDAQEPTRLDLTRDPIATVTGATEATIDASTFGGRCVGFIGARPAAILDVPEDTPALAIYARADALRIEERDTVLVVETSTGAVRCDDDSGGWPDPGIFAQLPAGPTRVWVGTYERSRAGTRFTLTVARRRTLGAEGIPSTCGVPTGNGSHGPVVVGARVVLGRHSPVSGGGDDAYHEVAGSMNWMPEMESFVGREATVTELEGEDGAGCPIVRVDADAGTWLWRVRDMARPAP